MPIFANIGSDIKGGTTTDKTGVHSTVTVSNQSGEPAKPNVPAPPSEPVKPKEPSTVESPVPIRKSIKRGVSSTPSIMEALRETPSADPTQSKVETSFVGSEKNKACTPFSQSQLLVQWKHFVEHLDNAPQLKSALNAREPSLAPDWTIRYDLDTELQLNRLTMEIKPKLLNFLRHQFKNDAIEIDFQVTDEPVHHSNTPFTEAERWGMLVDKYPALSQLKAKFGLDFEQM